MQVAWESGIAAYSSQHYHDAIKDFQLVERLNPSFTAANMFELKATALSTAQLNSAGGNSVSSTENTTVFGMPKSTILIIAITARILVADCIFDYHKRMGYDAGMNSRASKRRAQLKAEKDLWQNQKTKQHVESVEVPKQVPFLQHAITSGRNASPVNPQSPANTSCPNCGHVVRATATYCPNCRYQLSPVARGALPTLNISPVSELPIINKGPAPSATTEQPLVKEAILDEHAIQETFQRLWDKASR